MFIFIFVALVKLTYEENVTNIYFSIESHYSQKCVWKVVNPEY